jgi:hypothetical protein
MLPDMFVVTEAEATAIRAVFEQQGELSAAVELRRLFPCHHRQRAGAGVAVNRIERQSDTQAAERGLLPRPPARPDPEGGPDALKAAKHATTSRASDPPEASAQLNGVYMPVPVLCQRVAVSLDPGGYRLLVGC